jgi:hypothetical protein
MKNGKKLSTRVPGREFQNVYMVWWQKRKCFSSRASGSEFLEFVLKNVRIFQPWSEVVNFTICTWFGDRKVLCVCMCVNC